MFASGVVMQTRRLGSAPVSAVVFWPRSFFEFCACLKLFGNKSIHRTRKFVTLNHSESLAEHPWKRDSSSACHPTLELPSTYRLRLQQSWGRTSDIQDCSQLTRMSIYTQTLQGGAKGESTNQSVSARSWTRSRPFHHTVYTTSGHHLHQQTFK